MNGFDPRIIVAPMYVRPICPISRGDRASPVGEGHFSPPIFAYGTQLRMLQVVDSTFYFFIKNADTSQVLDSFRIHLNPDAQCLMRRFGQSNWLSRLNILSTKQI